VWFDVSTTVVGESGSFTVYPYPKGLVKIDLLSQDWRSEAESRGSVKL
jgi:hypothetical protein